MLRKYLELLGVHFLNGHGQRDLGLGGGGLQEALAGSQDPLERPHLLLGRQQLRVAPPGLRHQRPHRVLLRRVATRQQVAAELLQRVGAEAQGRTAEEHGERFELLGRVVGGEVWQQRLKHFIIKRSNNLANSNGHRHSPRI